MKNSSETLNQRSILFKLDSSAVKPIPSSGLQQRTELKRQRARPYALVDEQQKEVGDDVVFRWQSPRLCLS